MKRIQIALAMGLVVVLSTSSAAAGTDRIATLEKRVERATDMLRKQLDFQTRAAFDHSGELPTSDEFLAKIEPAIKNFEVILAGIDKCRQVLERKGLSADHPEMHRLNTVERKVTRVLGGRNRFVTGARWSGTMDTKVGAVQVELHITKARKLGFEGELIEIGRFGRPARVKVSGEYQGCQIEMQTGNMIIGEARSRKYSGYVFRDRLSAQVATMDQGSKGPKPGFAKLELNMSESLTSK